MIEQEISVDNISVEIFYDQFADNPREWDNSTKFVMFHNRYKLPNETDIRPQRLRIVGLRCKRHYTSEYKHGYGLYSCTTTAGWHSQSMRSTASGTRGKLASSC
jgi:hypothetical protein